MEYSNFAYIFSFDLVIELLDHIGINNYIIKPVKSKPLLYGPIYSLSLVELETLKIYIETLKIYIETHLKPGFIYLFKSLAEAPILFNKESDRNLCLCVNLQDLNNLTI